MMWWKVKKQMPSGSTKSRRPIEKPPSAARLPVKKSAYLNRPSTAQVQHDRRR